MQDRHFDALLAESVAEEDATANVGCEQQLGIDGPDLIELQPTQPIGDRGVFDEIVAGGAAAAWLQWERLHLESGNPSQQVAQRRVTADDIDLGARKMQGDAGVEPPESELCEPGIAGKECRDIQRCTPGADDAVADFTKAAAGADKDRVATGEAKSFARLSGQMIGIHRIPCVPREGAAALESRGNGDLVTRGFDQDPCRRKRVAIVDARDAASEQDDAAATGL